VVLVIILIIEGAISMTLSDLELAHKLVPFDSALPHFVNRSYVHTA